MAKQIDLKNLGKAEWKDWEDGARLLLRPPTTSRMIDAKNRQVAGRAAMAWDRLEVDLQAEADRIIRNLKDKLKEKLSRRVISIIGAEIKELLAAVKIFLKTAADEDPVVIGFTVFDYCVVDWEGIVAANGQAVPCNSENKQLLFDYSQELVAFVSATLTKMEAEQSLRLKVEEKNS